MDLDINNTTVYIGLYDVTDKNSQVLTMLSQLIIGFLTFSLTIWTVLGNIFVLFAISTNKVLKASGISNYLIGNLAFSDLLLGCTVLPFSAAFTTFKKWLFGKILCDIWLSIDVFCCTASIWCLCFIALDRYIATNQPVHYRTRKLSVKTALTYCTAPWIISVILGVGPLLMYSSETPLNSHVSNNFSMPENISLNTPASKSSEYNCILFHTPTFVVGSSFFSFYLPLFIMIFLYSRVFIKISQQSKRFHKKPEKRPPYQTEQNRAILK